MTDMNETVYRDFELFVYIVNYKDGTRVMKLAKEKGVRNSMTFLGHGTIESALLDFIGMNDIRKEIVLMAAEKRVGIDTFHRISKGMRLDKQGRGIAFSMGITRFIGSGGAVKLERTKERGEDNMYEAIFVVVDKGRGNLVVATAKEAGSRGATLISAKGSGIDDHTSLFEMEVEPEKEIILILSETQGVEKIIDAVKKECQLEEPGKGILFTCDVTRTFGLYEGK